MLCKFYNNKIITKNQANPNKTLSHDNRDFLFILTKES